MPGLASRLRATGSNRARLAATLLTAAIVALAAAPGAGAVTSVTYYAAPVAVGIGDCSSAANACLLGTTSDSTTALGKATIAPSVDAVTIDLASGTYAPITIASGSEGSLTLDGAGATASLISGAGAAQTASLDATGFSITLENLGLVGGDASGSGGNLVVDSGSDAVTLDDTAVQDGTTSADGGGIAVTGATLTIENSSISDNSAGSSESGGGLMVFANATVTIEDSTVSGNTASGGGAGIDLQSTGALNVLGSTIANNVGDAVTNAGTAKVYGSTVAGNTVGIDDLAANTVDLGGDVIAGNGVQDCAGATTDEGYNYASDATCPISTITSHDNESLAPGTFAAHGGPTQTIPITSASEAYDVIPIGAVLASDPVSGAFCASADQRGVPRTQGPATACSAGAFQYAPPVVTGVSPRASLELGLPVTLSGYGFGNLTSVTIGAVAPTLTSQSGAALAFNVPLSLSLGSQPVTLSNPDGTTVVTFSAVGSPSVATSTLSSGEYRAAYSQALSVAGGASPYTYALTSGALPAGLSLSSSGVVSGTPTAAGGTAFGVMITDANGISSLSSTVSLVIATPVVFVKSASVVVDATSAPPTAPVTLECTSAPCSGTAKLTESVKAHVHGKLKTLNVVLASAPYSLSAGELAVDDLALTTAGMQALKRAAKHPRTETLSASLEAGTSAARSVRVS